MASYKVLDDQAKLFKRSMCVGLFKLNIHAPEMNPIFGVHYIVSLFTREVELGFIYLCFVAQPQFAVQLLLKLFNTSKRAYRMIPPFEY